MSRSKTYRRPRRMDDNRFLPKDAAAWRALIRQATNMARVPSAKPDALMRAGDRCAKAVPPPGQARGDSAFVKLVILARGFWRLTPEARAVTAVEVGQLAKACAEVLDAPPPPPPGQRRADIFG